MNGTADSDLWGLALLAALCRTGGCFLVLPGFSSARVPVQVRLFAVLGICVSVAAFVPPIEMQGGHWSRLAQLIVSESLLGLFIGLLARLYLLALGFIATAIATVIGYGNITGAGIENGEPQAALGTLITMSAVVLLLQFDLHHHAITALIGSYALAAPMQPIATGMMLENLLSTLADAFLLVLQLGSPFIAYAVIANLAIGLINKLTPQIPVYFVSLPFLIAGGLYFFHIALPAFLMRFIEAVLDLYR